VVVEHPVGAGGVDRGDHPSGVAGQVVEVAQRELQALERDVQLAAEVGGPRYLTGTAGEHDRERDRGGLERRDVGVADHEGADQVAVRLRAAGDVGPGRVAERGVAGREDGGVVDQATPGRAGGVR
jgi:hypothetical protein